jgi:hypothetical protein
MFLGLFLYTIQIDLFKLLETTPIKIHLTSLINIYLDNNFKSDKNDEVCSDDKISLISRNDNLFGHISLVEF